jgi:hypothetical protein
MSASRRIFPDVHDTTPSRYIQVLYKSQLSPEMPWHPPQWMGNSALRPDLPEHFAPDRCRWILPWRSAPPPLHFSSAHPALEPHMVVCMYVHTITIIVGKERRARGSKRESVSPPSQRCPRRMPARHVVEAPFASLNVVGPGTRQCHVDENRDGSGCLRVSETDQLQAR